MDRREFLVNSAVGVVAAALPYIVETTPRKVETTPRKVETTPRKTGQPSVSYVEHGIIYFGEEPQRDVGMLFCGLTPPQPKGHPWRNRERIGSIETLVAPAPIMQAFYDRFSDVTKVRENVLTIAGPGGKDGRRLWWRLREVVLVSIGQSVESHGMLVSGGVQFLAFEDMEWCDPPAFLKNLPAGVATRQANHDTPPGQ